MVLYGVKRCTIVNRSGIKKKRAIVFSLYLILYIERNMSFLTDEFEIVGILLHLISLSLFAFLIVYWIVILSQDCKKKRETFYILA